MAVGIIKMQGLMQRSFVNFIQSQYRPKKSLSTLLFFISWQGGRHFFCLHVFDFIINLAHAGARF